MIQNAKVRFSVNTYHAARLNNLLYNYVSVPAVIVIPNGGRNWIQAVSSAVRATTDIHQWPIQRPCNPD